MSARNLARLSPEREAEAVEMIARGWAYSHGESLNAEFALKRLREAGYLLLHADDVTVEEQHEWDRSVHVRLVTPWQEVSE